MSKKTIKLVVLNNALHGHMINLPIVGVVEISKDGTLDVPEELAEQLLGNSSDWALYGEKSTEDNDNDGEDDANADVSEEDVDKSLTKFLIKNFNEDELKGIAKDNQLSKTVISKAKSKADLVKMIVNKLSLSDKLELMKANN